MSETKKIEIANIGPIEQVTIPLPAAGIVVLRGRNGRGKSHALAAVDSALSGTASPPIRDGQKQGRVDAAGVTLVVGRRTKRAGEADVVVESGSEGIADIVDPGLKDPKAADARRIKTLASYAQSDPTPELFASQMVGQVGLANLLEENSEIAATDNVVLLADRLKRAAEAIARRIETRESETRGQIQAIAEELSQVDLDEVQDSDPHADFVAATERLGQLEARRQEVNQDRAQRKHAQSIIDEKDRSDELSELRTEFAAICVQHEDLADQITDTERQIDALTAKLTSMKDRQEMVSATRDAQEMKLGGLEQVAKTIDKARDTLAAERPPEVTPEELDEANLRIDEAKRRIAQSEQRARARVQVERRDELRQEVATMQSTAKQYRATAQKIASKLRELIGGSGGVEWTVDEDGRLRIKTDRGDELYAELSHAERYRAAIKSIAPSVWHADGGGGLLTIPQEAWEGMDRYTRADVAEVANELGIVILTAECADNEQLQPVPYEAESEAVV